MNFKKLFFLIIACSLTGWIQAADDNCGTITVTAELLVGSGTGTNLGVIEITVVESEYTANKVLTLERTAQGGGSSTIELSTLTPESTDGTTTVYRMRALAADTYTITARKYCLVEWGAESLSSSANVDIKVTPTITGEGGTDPVDPPIPTFSASVYSSRPALPCVSSGYIVFTITDGTLPFVITITDVGENGDPSQIGRTHIITTRNTNINTRNRYTMYNIPAGDYTFNISDATLASINLTYTIGEVSNTSLKVTSTSFTYPLPNDLTKPYIRVSQSGFTAVDSKSGMSNYTSTDTIRKYFDYSWYLVDKPETTYEMIYYSSNTWLINLADAGLSYKDVMACSYYDNEGILQTNEEGKEIAFRLKMKKSVLNSEDCDINSNDSYTNKLTLLFEPVKESLAFFSAIDDNCNLSLKFPKATEYKYQIPVLFPLSYTIYKVNNQIVDYDNPVVEGTYNDFSTSSNPLQISHVVDPGSYYIVYKDPSGLTWDQEISLENVEPEPYTITYGPNGPYSNRRTDLPIDIVPEDHSDAGTLVTAHTYIQSMSTPGVLRYDEVPDNYHFKKGEEVVIPAKAGEVHLGTYNIASGNGPFYQMYPGYYKVSMVTKCGVETPMEFMVNSPGVQDFKYNFTYNCAANGTVSVSLRIEANVRSPRMVVSNGVTDGISRLNGDPESLSPSYVEIRPLYGDRTKILSYGGRLVLNKDGDVYAGSFTVPTDALTKGDKIIVQFMGSQASSGTDFIAKYYAFEREVPLADFKSYSALAFDYTKSSGYSCGEGATITALAANGVPPYTYELWSGKPDAGTLIETKSGEANVIPAFNFTDASATNKEYWVRVTDSSDCEISLSQEVPVYALAGRLPIAKAESVCEDDDVTLTTVYIDGGSYTWYKDGIEITSSSTYYDLNTNSLTIKQIDASREGLYRVDVNPNNAACGTITTSHAADIRITPQVMIWNPVAGSSDWNDEKNWIPQNKGIPAPCTDVYIPGDLSGTLLYPSLNPISDDDYNQRNVCRDIYFMPGAQIGQPQLLNYRYAAVQYDFGAGVMGSIQDKNTVAADDLIQAGRDNITSEHRLKFGAARSGITLNRHRWNTLSSGLGDVVTGDFAFGGFPFSYIKKFDPEGSDGGFIYGNWSDYSNEAGMKFKPGQGFGHLYYGSTSYPYYSMDRKDQWEGVKEAKSLNADQPISSLGESYDFGLAYNNGIVQLPYFADSYLSQSHRTHTYSGIVSRFDFYYQAPLYSPEYLSLTGNSNLTLRTDAAHRFIAEQTYGKNDMDFIYNVGTVNQGDYILIGNPYMSAFDYAAFASVNSGKIVSTGYQIYDGTTGYYALTSSDKVAPMQSILVQVGSSHTNGSNLELSFVATDMAKTDNVAKLKSSATLSYNALEITATTANEEVKTYLKQSQEASDEIDNLDLGKIIGEKKPTRPEIYTVALNHKGQVCALAINNIASNSQLVPLGLVTVYNGEISFTITGMNTYDANISFIDAAKGVDVDISERESYTYSFNHTAELDASSNAKPIESRFFIRLTSKGTTKMEGVENNSITAHVEGNDLAVVSSAVAIQKIEVFDIQGRIVAKTEGINSLLYKLSNVFPTRGVYIVKVYTEKEAKEVKVIR